MNLDGARILVSGSNRGIGLAICRELARRRVHILAGVRDPERGHPLLHEQHRAIDVTPVRLDLSSFQGVAESADALGDSIEEVDVLINNAGQLVVGLLEEQRMADIDAMLHTNLLGLIHLTRLMLPGMLLRGRGRIVNNASIAAVAPLPTATTYSASKAAVWAFTEALHRELRGTGVSTMLLLTGAVQTDMYSALERAEAGRVDMSAWRRTAPDAWARRVVSGIERDARVVHGNGRIRLLELAAHGPLGLVDAITARMFRRP